MINAIGGCAQISVRSTDKIDYIVSNELKLYRNSPDFVKDTYISHRHVDGVGLLVQTEANVLAHNLLDPANTGSSLVEKAVAGDLQALTVIGTTEIGVVLVNYPGAEDFEVRRGALGKPIPGVKLETR